MRMLLKEPLLTVSEVAERLRVSTKTVRRRISALSDHLGQKPIGHQPRPLPRSA